VAGQPVGSCCLICPKGNSRARSRARPGTQDGRRHFRLTADLGPPGRLKIPRAAGSRHGRCAARTGRQHRSCPARAGSFRTARRRCRRTGPLRRRGCAAPRQCADRRAGGSRARQPVRVGPGFRQQRVDDLSQAAAGGRSALPCRRAAPGQGRFRELRREFPVAGRLQHRPQIGQQLPDELVRGHRDRGRRVDQVAVQAGLSSPPGRGLEQLRRTVGAARPASAAPVSRMASPRNSPASRTTSSSRAQASQIRSSTVGRWAEGRTSK
jgi:hypothetical protein